MDVTDAYVLFLAGCGSIFHSLIFLSGKDINFLYAVCILDMFNLCGLVAIRSMISKMVPREHLGKAFGVLASVQAIVEWLSAEYYWIYTATLNWHPGFVYCLNGTCNLIFVLPISFVLVKKLRRVELEYHGETEQIVDKLEETMRDMTRL